MPALMRWQMDDDVSFFLVRRPGRAAQSRQGTSAGNNHSVSSKPSAANLRSCSDFASGRVGASA
eukprot:7324418-Pyramimonas_sp.AAC.1